MWLRDLVSTRQTLHERLFHFIITSKIKLISLVQQIFLMISRVLWCPSDTRSVFFFSFLLLKRRYVNGTGGVRTFRHSPRVSHHTPGRRTHRGLPNDLFFQDSREISMSLCLRPHSGLSDAEFRMSIKTSCKFKILMTRSQRKQLHDPFD